MIEFKVDVLFGSCEIEQRPVFSSKGLGFETRKICRCNNGVITEITDWSPPLGWFSMGHDKKVVSIMSRIFDAVLDGLLIVALFSVGAFIAGFVYQRFI